MVPADLAAQATRQHRHRSLRMAHAKLTAACVQVAISTVMQIHEQQASGDILLFLTGKGEIDKVCLAACVSAFLQVCTMQCRGGLPAQFA